MDDLRARIARRKRERRKRATIRLAIFAAIVAVIVLIVCFSCNNENADTPAGNTGDVVQTTPVPEGAVPSESDATGSFQPIAGDETTAVQN